MALLDELRLAGLRLGPIGVGRGLPSALEELFGRLLGTLQQTLRGEHCGASQCATGALCQLDRARRHHGGSRFGIHGPQAGSIQYRRDFRQRNGERPDAACAADSTGDPSHSRGEAGQRNTAAGIDVLCNDTPVAQIERAGRCNSSTGRHRGRAAGLPLGSERFRAELPEPGYQARAGGPRTDCEYLHSASPATGARSGQPACRFCPGCRPAAPARNR